MAGRVTVPHVWTKVIPNNVVCPDTNLEEQCIKYVGSTAFLRWTIVLKFM